ncbi:MAG: WxL protein peptidoglycan domain-containing protein [Candidatus Levyibacteriota bacterium]
MRVRVCLLFLLIALFPLFTPRVFAKENVSLSPAYQEVIFSDEPEKTIQFTLTNNTKKTFEFELNPVNFAPADQNGGLKFFEAEKSSYLFSLVSYMQLESPKIQLEPGEKKTIPVTIMNRQDLSPGGHYAALVVRQVPIGEQTQVTEAVSALIFLKKTGGERYNLSLKDVSWPASFITFSYPHQTSVLFQNEGNIHVVPYGTVSIKDMFGRQLYKGVLNEDSFFVLPDSRRNIFITFHEDVEWGIPISFNTISISGADSLKKVHYSYETTFLYVNPYVTGGLVIMLAGYFLFKGYGRRKKKT